MEKEIVHIHQVVTRLPELRFAEPVEWRICEGEQWAVVGPNGAGKTLLADILQRKFAFREGKVCYNKEGKVSDIIQALRSRTFIHWLIVETVTTSNAGMPQNLMMYLPLPRPMKVRKT